MVAEMADHMAKMVAKMRISIKAGMIPMTNVNFSQERPLSPFLQALVASQQQLAAVIEKGEVEGSGCFVGTVPLK